MANGVLSLPTPRTGIDLLGIEKGRRAAQNDNYEDIRRMQAQEQYAFERENQLLQMREQQFDRQAAAYVAPFLSNQQMAADQGVDNLEWLIGQRQAVLNDAAFQSMPPEVQQRILQQIGASATAIAQQQIQAGDVGAAQRLYSALGVNYASPVAQVAQSGDARTIVDAAIQQGAKYTISADGRSVTDAQGITAPIEQVAWLIAQSPNNLSNAMPAFAAVLEQQRQDSLAAQQAAIMRSRQALELQLAGYVRGPDGLWRHPQQPTQAFSLEFPAGSVAGGVSSTEEPVLLPVPMSVPTATGSPPASAAVTGASGAQAGTDVVLPPPVVAPAVPTPADGGISDRRRAVTAGPVQSAFGLQPLPPLPWASLLPQGQQVVTTGRNPFADAAAVATEAFVEQARTPDGARQVRMQGPQALATAIRGIEDRLREIGNNPAQQAEINRLSIALGNLRNAR